MALPGYLGNNMLSLYGIGTATGVSGIVAPKGFLFSTVEQVFNGSSINAEVGSSVLYREADEVCKLAYANAIHVILPVDKIVFTEIYPS